MTERFMPLHELLRAIKAEEAAKKNERVRMVKTAPEADVMVVLMSDSYASDPNTQRDFGAAVLLGKVMLVLHKEDASPEQMAVVERMRPVVSAVREYATLDEMNQAIVEFMTATMAEGKPS